MIDFRKDLFADERDDNLNEVGQPTIRQDILGHVTGRSPFFDDHQFDGLTHLKCVRSPHHRARIRRVDTTMAERMPGVRRVITWRDIPLNKNTLLSLIDFGKDDEPVLAENQVNYIGEPVVAVIADTERQARDAVAAVSIDYEVLPHVLDVEEALLPDAPVVNETYPDNSFDYHEKYDHQKLRFGDVEKAFAAADHIVEARYQMSPIEHAPTETNGAIAVMETNDRIACYTSTQALFFSLGTSAKLLDVSSAKLHFVGGTVGGGFGGKVDTVVEPLAILGCLLTGRPVRFVYDREEEMQVSSPRGAERWYIKDGVMNDGRIVARQFRGYFDGGAYTRLTSYAVVKCVGHLPGPYTIPNVSANVYGVYTNRTPASAMRGFGITGVDFSIECHMDRVAEAVGMNPVELRMINAYRDGDMKAHRRVAKNTALIECMQVAAEKSGWVIGEEFKRMSSLEGGGGERASIADTVTDQEGRIGSSRQSGGAGGRAGTASVPRPRVVAAPAPLPAVQAVPQAAVPAATSQTRVTTDAPVYQSAPVASGVEPVEVPQRNNSAATPPGTSPPVAATASDTAASSTSNGSSASSTDGQNTTDNTTRKRRDASRFSSLFGTRRR